MKKVHAHCNRMETALRDLENILCSSIKKKYASEARNRAFPQLLLCRMVSTDESLYRRDESLIVPIKLDCGLNSI